MTAQVQDRVAFNNTDFDMIGVNGEGLFTPETFGMRPVMIHTACYRGFYLQYELSQDTGLLLQELTLRELNDNYVPVHGVVPERSEYQAAYHNLNLPVAFSGQMRLGADFIQELYIHMGYQKPSAYKTVLDISLENGQIVEVKDRSEDAAAIRGGFKEKYHSGSVMEGIKNAFDLDMGFE